MATRLLVAFVLVSFSSVAFGASPNPSVEERMAILETKFDALSKQIEADRQSTLRLIEVTNEATNKRIEASNKATNERIEASNEATNERIEALSKQIEALSKQVDANRQSILKLIEVTNEATNKRIETSNEATNKWIEASNEATNKRIDTLNNWGIALFASVLAWIGVFITHALGFWGVSKRDNAVTTDANRPEASPVMQSVDA